MPSQSSSSAGGPSPAAATLTVHCEVPNLGFEVRSLKMTETMGQPFVIELDLQNLSFEINMKALLGKGMGVGVALPSGSRYFHGRVAQIELGGASGRFALYKVVLRPWPWLLTRTTDCRIFQDKTVPWIITEGIFRDHQFVDFEDALQGSYAARTYCVQYREDDLNFVHRLMQEEGIYYYFNHAEDKHTLVLCDGAIAHDPATGYETVSYRASENDEYANDVMFEWRDIYEMETFGYEHLNYDFENPTLTQTSLKTNSTKAAGTTDSKLQFFDYPGPHLTEAEGKRYAGVRREELQLQHERFLGRGNARGIGVGHKFTLDGFPRAALNQEYLVIKATHELASTQHELGTQGDHMNYRFSSNYVAIKSATPFRPPRSNRKPSIRGPQTAVVTGPQNTELHTDKYGRVKLKFHWDRHGKADDTSSCWVRVSSALAGKNWGHIYLPRVGQEVIVEFLEGDPDRPIVTGRVYNKDLMPPYELPANATKSTMKSMSSTKGDATTFNELRFEDKKDAEEVYFHAQKDFNRVVENNDTLKVGYEKMDKGDQTIGIYHDRTITIGNNETITIGEGKGMKDGNQTVTINKHRSVTLKTGDDTLTLKAGKQTNTINKSRATTIQTGDDTLKLSAGAHTTDAAKSITLKVGGNKIVIDQQGILIQGMKVTIKGNMLLDMKGGMSAKLAGGIALTLQGGIVKIN